MRDNYSGILLLGGVINRLIMGIKFYDWFNLSNVLIGVN